MGSLQQYVSCLKPIVCDISCMCFSVMFKNYSTCSKAVFLLGLRLLTPSCILLGGPVRTRHCAFLHQMWHDNSRNTVISVLNPLSHLSPLSNSSPFLKQIKISHPLFFAPPPLINTVITKIELRDFQHSRIINMYFVTQNYMQTHKKQEKVLLF